MNLKLSLKWFGGLALLLGSVVLLWAQVVVRLVH
jgi:hypothetical protein